MHQNLKVGQTRKGKLIIETLDEIFLKKKGTSLKFGLFSPDKARCVRGSGKHLTIIYLHTGKTIQAILFLVVHFKIAESMLEPASSGLKFKLRVKQVIVKVKKFQRVLHCDGQSCIFWSREKSLRVL